MPIFEVVEVQEITERRTYTYRVEAPYAEAAIEKCRTQPQESYLGPWVCGGLKCQGVGYAVLQSSKEEDLASLRGSPKGLVARKSDLDSAVDRAVEDLEKRTCK